MGRKQIRNGRKGENTCNPFYHTLPLLHRRNSQNFSNAPLHPPSPANHSFVPVSLYKKNRLKTPTDINTPFTLLSDVRGLMTWLGSESSWKHGKRAEEALRQLLALLMPLSETRRRSMEREAYQLICEVGRVTS